MADTMTLYKAENILNLPDPYTKSDVKKCYRKLILEKHPDISGESADKANEEAALINAAKTLIDKRFENCADGVSFARKKEETYQSQPSYSPGYGYEETIPVNINITWEELLNMLWREEPKAYNTEYSARARQHDSFEAAARWAAKNAARSADGADTISWEEAQRKAREEYEAAFPDWYVKRRDIVEKFTSRIAVLIYSLIIAAFVSVLFPLHFLGILFSIFIVDCAIINLIIPFVTMRLREPLVNMLNRKLDEDENKQGNV